ncbi:protein scarlet-like isoform X2 [Bacillus rossius redtenbacheri]
MDSDESSASNLTMKETGVTLTWNDLSIWAKRKKQEDIGFWKRQRHEEFQILNNVSGFVRSGTLMAIMGGSGAGKTTLLAAISQRVKGKISGQVMLNGRVVNQKIMADVSGFVPQLDLMVDTLSVEEHMEFMAQMKMDRRVQKLQRKRRIHSLILELGLNKCSHTRLSALSGGEKRRLSLAVQLLNDPSILFCDEPTTGLDSYSATAVVEKLQQFTASGKAVVCTIHQPASGIFDLFNSVLLLACGRVAFYGDVKDAPKHFSSLGLICPPTYNQAEFYISQLAVVPSREEESHRKIQWLCDEFENSHYGQELTRQMALATGSRSSILSLLPSSKEDTWDNMSEKSTSTIESKSEVFEQYHFIQKPKYFTQLYWLAWRSFIDLKRHSSQNLLQLFLYLCVGLLISTPYTNLVMDEQTGIQNMQGLLYLTVTETIFTYSYSVFHTFPQEIPVLLREIGNGLYNPGPYYISKMLISIPRAIFGPLVYTGLIFYIVGLQGGAIGFFLFCIPVIFCAVSATAYG